ncbi:S-locus glycoprotein domain-containing protein [Artemisia annua]|uniref:Receptor-like serine/threonine-protein kinase n=1 Tax=Artemisia annua TaxID=35608 RepID=A0A2U1MKG2_ARTAN|nr:S-locus glycoprotein domain-containing protein [Artemisia annua]
MNGSVPIGSSLTATENARSWLSPSGDFAFGFQRIQGKDNYVLSIWYDKIPDKTIIWYPQGNPMVSRGSKIELINGRGLVLSDPQGTDLWVSRPISNLAYAVMNDTGNFELFGSDSRKIWESFSFPGDTLLPTQIMKRGWVINSKKSETNFTGGRFQLRLLEDGNLVLNSRDIRSNYANKAYYISDTYDPSNSTNSGDQLMFDATGYMYILRRNGQRFNLTPNDALPSGDYYHRATLGFDGVFIQYYHPKNSVGNTSWSVSWLVPENICRDIIGEKGSGACGFNNVCSLNGASRPNCECPAGLPLLDPSDPYGDCKLNFTPSCNEGDFDFMELTGVDWPGTWSVYVQMDSVSTQECKDSCLHDCFCAVAIHNGDTCWKKRLPLSSGWTNESLSMKAFLKYRKGELPSVNFPRFPGKKKNQKTIITIISALLGSSVFVNVIFIGVICLGFFLNYQRKTNNHYPDTKSLDTNLTHFTYRELVEATNGFKEEVGKGAFGIVYKDERPSWKKRRQLALGIAKGLAYLHEECSTQIIHCDIKPQNILLDEYYNAKISDFGLAKLLIKNQSRTNTGIRGTKGYVAPEWFRNTPVTTKVDVYSFGVLILEIISCRKSVKENESGNDYGAILTDWAWDCYEERILDTLVGNDLEALDDYKNLTTFVMVGLWCVQENPSLRPTMRNVIQMLDGVVEVSEPPCPFPLSVTIS